MPKGAGGKAPASLDTAAGFYLPPVGALERPPPEELPVVLGQPPPLPWPFPPPPLEPFAILLTFLF